MKLRNWLLFTLLAIHLAGCASHVFRAGFDEKSEGDLLGTTPTNYWPPENPTGDVIRSTYLTAENHKFTDNLALSPGDTALMILPITPAQQENVILDFQSMQISGDHNKYTFAWSGRKKGNLVLNCVFGTQKSTQTESLEPDFIKFRFGDGKAYFFMGVVPNELGVLPNDVEHRFFLTVRPNSDSYYLSIKNSQSPELIHTGTITAPAFEDFNRIRAECQYDGTAPPASNHYVFDDLEFRAKKN